MIQSIGKSKGRPAALCVCDDCGVEQETVCDYESRPNGKWLPNEGQVIKKMTAWGWSHVKGKMRCPNCETARKNKELTVTNVEPIRQPSREQKRQIIEMLTAVYDTAAERYIGTETDVTVAEAIGGGCMFGWVAAIREDMFGPEGGNEEHIALMADIATWRANADKLADEMAGSLREFNECRAKVKELETRFAAVVKALGPKVKSA